MATPTTKRRTQPPEVRREQLLDAAATLLVEKGFAAMTVADVAERAGVAKGTVYLYFDTKEALVAGIQAKYDHSLVAMARVLNEARGSELGRLESYLRATVDFHVAERELHQVLFHQAGMRDHESLHSLAKEMEVFIASGVDSGAFHVDDPRFTAGFMLHGLHGALVSYLHDPRSSRARFVSSCMTVCRQLLGVQ
jgi:TetR/AcrR family transcriptional regulator, transcriptional repressor for nem operon